MLPLGAHVRNNAVHNVKVELVQKARLLEVGNKLVGEKPPVLWVHPARKRLLVADVARGRAHHCLVVRANPSLADGLVKTIEHVVAQVCGSPHVVGKPCDVRLPRLAVQVARRLCTIKAHRHNVVFGIADIRAGTHGRNALKIRTLKVGKHGVNAIFYAHLTCKRIKVILGKPRACLVAKAPAKHVRKGAEKPISLVATIARVKALHAHEVKGQEHRPLATCKQGLRANARQVVEAVHAGQPREPVHRCLGRDLHHERVERRPPIRGALHKLAVLKDGLYVPCFGPNAIVHVVKALATPNLAPNAVLDHTEVVFVNQLFVGALRERKEIVDRVALEHGEHLLVGMDYLLVAICQMRNHTTRRIVGVDKKRLFKERMGRILHGKSPPFCMPVAWPCTTLDHSSNTAYHMRNKA